jgi:preprotein translocase subunit SecG
MVILLTIIHVLVCLFLIIVVLLQSGKAADLAGAFGGMGSQTAFGPRGAATILSKATTVAAALFMVTSLSLSIFATRGAGGASTVLEKHLPAAKQETKKAPEPGKSGGTVTLTPEGGDPSKGVAVPIPSVEELKKSGAVGVPAVVREAEAKAASATKKGAAKDSQTAPPKK